MGEKGWRHNDYVNEGNDISVRGVFLKRGRFGWRGWGNYMRRRH